MPLQAIKADPTETIRVLAVDDDHTSLFLLATQMEDMGYEVTTAKNGKVSVQKARTTQFHLIFMNMQMPELDGLGAATHERPALLLYHRAFLADARQKIENISELLKANSDEIIVPAHIPKSSSRLMGGFKVSNIAAQIEANVTHKGRQSSNGLSELCDKLEVSSNELESQLMEKLTRKDEYATDSNN